MYIHNYLRNKDHKLYFTYCLGSKKVGLATATERIIVKTIATFNNKDKMVLNIAQTVWVHTFSLK